MLRSVLRAHPSSQKSRTPSRSYATAPGLPKFDYTPSKYEGPSKEAVLAQRKEHLHPNLFMYYKKPIMIVEGKMQYLWDEEGTRYLDLFAGIVTVSVGHCHPYVTEKAVDQMRKLQHTTTIYAHPTVAEFAKKLTDTMPKGSDLKVCYFVNSGSEANDLALLMSRLYTKNYDVLALRNAYHGASSTTMGLTAYNTWRFPLPSDYGIKHCLNPDTYRGPFKKSDPDAAKKYANDVKNVIEHCTPGQVAGFICESIQGVGGAVTPPPGYLKEVYKTVRSHGGVCISDEVQAGFGRTGTNFWGFEIHDVVPDIVTTAKGIGNGFPLAAVITKPEIAAAMNVRTHFNTFGGNPIAMAMGSATLDVIKNEKIQENAHNMGEILRKGLLDLQKKHKLIGEVRGRGLMIGVELVRDHTTLEPANTEAAQLMEMGKEHGILFGKGGLYGNILRIKPPMCINKEDCHYFLEVLDKSLTEISK